MKKDVTTKYLALFLLIDLVMVGVLLCFFSHKEWWNNWMVTAPNLYMILGALYCPMMKKNLDKQVTRQTWFYVYKGIKMVLTVATMVLYIIFIKENSKAFIIITAAAYLVALVAETCVYNHYVKHKNKESKA